MTLKLKRTPGLYLVGFMACGKSTVGRMLAGELGWCFIDIDAEIEATEGQTIEQIFQERAEAGFRDLETKMIRARVSRIECGLPCVVALGGGALLKPDNWELVENNGVTVWLDCPFQVIQARLGTGSGRPLASNGTNLAALFENRRPTYERADFRIVVENSDVQEIVLKILELPIF